MWEAWARGDRKAALAEIPDSVVDELLMHGAPETVRERVLDYARAGVDTPIMALTPTPEVTDADTLAELMRRLGNPQGAQ